MYFYEIEKTLPVNFNAVDVQQLGNIITNVENIHRVLGILFGVNKEVNWRQKYNILFKVLNITTCKLFVKSDIPIDRNICADYKFIVREKFLKEIKNGDILNIDIVVSPFKKNNSKNRVYIKDNSLKELWLKNKFEFGGESLVTDCKKIEDVCYNMLHEDDSKGGTMLLGVRYQLQIKVLDKDKFENLIKSGIGPTKSYGFGLLEVKC